MPVTAVDASEAGPQGPGQPEITDDLVREVADKVLAMLLQELRIEQERRHQPRQGALLSRGGW